MQNIPTDKLRWGEHQDNCSLVELQFNNCGMWYTIEGTATNSLADALKYVIMERYARSFNLI